MAFVEIEPPVGTFEFVPEFAGVIMADPTHIDDVGRLFGFVSDNGAGASSNQIHGHRHKVLPQRKQRALCLYELPLLIQILNAANRGDRQAGSGRRATMESQLVETVPL